MAASTSSGAGARRVGGVNLSVIQDAKLDGIDARFFRQFVDRDFERHQTGGFAGRTHGVPFRQIKRGEPQAGMTIRPGVE